MLITGASRGIGRATAVAASQHGATVVLVARSPEGLQATASELSGTGHSIIPFDLRDLDGIAELVLNASDSLGGLDTIVHSAGVQSTVPLRALKPAMVREMFETNVTSALMLAKGFRHKLVPKSAPSLVLISSVAGLVGHAAESGYSASKGAIIAVTRSLAIELARDGIRVNCVCPGAVRTEMTEQIRIRIGEAAFRQLEDSYPLGLGEADDVAQAILFLASDASRWMTGSSLVIDGGYTAQ